MAPSFFEILKVFFEPGARVVVFDVILGELLDDHKNEQIEHDVSDNHDEREEKDGCEACPTRFPGDAVRRRVHAVVHDSIPVLARRYREEQLETQMEVREVFPLVDHLALSHLVEERVAQHSHDEKDEHEQNEDVDQRRHGHLDRLQEGLEALVLAGQTEHSADSEHAEHSCELGTHGENLAIVGLVAAFRRGKC